MNKIILNELIQWLEDQGRDNPYCQAGINIVYHAGIIKKIEKNISVKVLNE